MTHTNSYSTECIYYYLTATPPIPLRPLRPPKMCLSPNINVCPKPPTDDIQEDVNGDENVFVVDLLKSEKGLGLGLIDGLVSIYMYFNLRTCSHI